MRVVRSVRLLGCLAVAASISSTASAQAVIEEIVVSATKRGDTNIQDVPISIQALSGDTLAELGASDFADYFRLVPGVSMLEQGSGDRRYIVRGVNSAGAGTVGLYLDEVIITGENAQDGGGRQPDIRLFDLDRVEVLKGPQGTTFGSSSLAGTIRYITRKPVLGEFEGSAQIGVEDIDGGNMGWTTQGAVNIPVGDKFALRASGYYKDSAGYIDSQFRDNTNGSKVGAGRIIARFEPSETVRLSLMAMHQDLDGDGQSYYNRINYTGVAISPGDDYTQADIVQTAMADNITLYNATAEIDLAFGRLTGVASRMERDVTYSRDSSLVMQRFVGRPAFTTGRSAIIQPKETKLDTYEVRLSSLEDARLQYLVGLFHQKEDRDFRSSIQPAPNGIVVFTPGYSLNRTIDTNLKEYAAFGELSFAVTDELTLTGGARYYDFSIREIANNIAPFSGAPGTGFGNPLSSKEDGVIFRGNVSYEFTPDQMGYVQIAEGFRPGGTNDQVAALIGGVTIPQGYNSDSVLNYEVGFKSTLADGRLRFNPALYLIKWSDIQLGAESVGPGGRFPYRTNGGGAEIRGAELDIAWYPIDAWEIAVGAAATHAALTENNPLPASGLDGDDVPYVPRFTASLSSRYEWAVGGSLMAHIGGDLTRIGIRKTEYRQTNASYIKLRANTVLNLRAGLTGSEDNWDAVLALNNATNENKQIDVFRIVAGLYPDGVIINRPRTLSLAFTKRF